MTPASALIDRVFATNWHAVRLIELSKWLKARSHPALSHLSLGICRFLTGVEVQFGAVIGERLVISHGSGIVIGGYVKIGDDCAIFQQVTLGSNGETDDQPCIGDRVTIYAGAKLLGGISVGDDARIGANAVVRHDVPPGAVMVGVPARDISRRATAP